MEKIRNSSNFNELAGKYGTPKITIAFMIRRHEKDYYPDERPPLSRDTKSTIRRALELEYYDDLYKELYNSIILFESVQTPKELKESTKIRINMILEHIRYDISDEIICLSHELMLNEITLYQPFTNQKVLFSREDILARLKLLLSKFLTVQ